MERLLADATLATGSVRTMRGLTCVFILLTFAVLIAVISWQARLNKCVDGWMAMHWVNYNS